MSKLFPFVCVLLLLAGFIGCGGVQSVSVKPAPPLPAKGLLEEIATSGELGSVVETIREGLTALAKTDAKKSEELLKDLTDLQKTSGAAKIKEKAKAMAAKL